MHCMPCCNQCPVCGMNVKFIYYSEHVERCEKERAELEALIEEKNSKVTLVVGDVIDK